MFHLNIKALKNLLPLLILCFGIFAVSCGDDDTVEPEEGIDCTGVDPSYMTDIKPIIDATCALAGCHVAGFVNGDYTTYAGLKAKVDNGSLLRRAVEDKDMPSPDTTGPTSLSTDQIKLINCWIEDGAPNN
ncbi:MAG: hypothetical protein ACI8VT_003821 [Saprospiraceae bacterium]|jgi:hypothetical protein